MAILKSQRNSVYQAVEMASIPPSEFIWTETDPDFRLDDWSPVTPPPYTMLLHTSTDCYFVFGGPDTANDLLWRYFPNEKGAQTTGWSADWEGVLEVVTQWLAMVATEREPDLWANLQKATAYLEEQPEGVLFFDESEILDIEAKLSSLIQEAEQNWSLSGDHLRVLTEGMEYLKGELRKQSVRDWGFLALGFFFDLATRISGNDARTLMEYAVQLVNAAVTHHPLLP